MRSSSVRFNSARERAARPRGLVVVAALWALSGCRGGVTPWDVGALERETPGLLQHSGHRLADVSPHFWVSGGDLLLFLCTWPQDRPVPVALQGATEQEDALVSRALAALEGAVAGLAFERVPELVDGVGIELSIRDLPSPAQPRGGIPPSGEATVDCRVEEPFGSDPVATPLAANLERGEVWLLRARYDPLGRVTPLSETELLAVLLHELGHAVGFGAHATWGDTLMRASPWEASLRAAAVLRGEPLEDPTLAALYAVPSGAVVRQVKLPARSAATGRVFGDLARRLGWGLARSRAGERSAEVWWRGGLGERRVLRASRRPGPWPEAFVLRANAAARDALQRVTGARRGAASNPP